MYKHFSNREKKYIKSICNLKNGEDATILFKNVIERTNVNYWNDGSKNFMVPAGMTLENENIAIKEFIEIALLIHYLKINDYIVFNKWNFNAHHSFPYGKNTGIYVNCLIPDNVASELDICLDSSILSHKN